MEEEWRGCAARKAEGMRDSEVEEAERDIRAPHAAVGRVVGELELGGRSNL